MTGVGARSLLLLLAGRREALKKVPRKRGVKPLIFPGRPYPSVGFMPILTHIWLSMEHDKVKPAAHSHGAAEQAEVVIHAKATTTVKRGYVMELL